jgi:hypothetical protein
LLTIRVFGRQGGQTPTEHHQRLNGDAGAHVDAYMKAFSWGGDNARFARAVA